MSSSVLEAPRLHVRAIVEGVGSGALRASDVLSNARERIAAENERLRAFVHVAIPTLTRHDGPLAGVPVGVKDIIDTADMPTEMGSKLYRDHRPRFDASLVAMARGAGASILGKTATTEFASLDPTRTRNPAAPSRAPGGSSSGSAAAVAAGLCAAAFGTQTAASVVRPAAFCGIAGYKPSFRLLPTSGIKTFAWSLDTAGLFAARVEDAALFAHHLTGRPLAVGDPADLSGLTLGVYRSRVDDRIEPEMSQALETARMLLERGGARIRDIAEPAALHEGRECHGTIMAYEGSHALMSEHRSGGRIGPKLQSLLDDGARIPVASYDGARRTARIARKAANALFETVDAIVMPSAFGAAPEGLSSTGDPTIAKLWTLTGNPVVNVPGLATEGGLPLGLSVVARFGRDPELLSIACAVERALAAR